MEQARHLHSRYQSGRHDSKDAAAELESSDASLIAYICNALVKAPPCARFYLLGDAFRREGNILRAGQNNVCVCVCVFVCVCVCVCVFVCV